MLVTGSMSPTIVPKSTIANSKFTPANGNRVSYFLGLLSYDGECAKFKRIFILFTEPWLEKILYFVGFAALVMTTSVLSMNDISKSGHVHLMRRNLFAVERIWRQNGFSRPA